MYRNKKDVDKHVENLASKLSAKEFNTRAYSVARLYFEVGDYVNCQKYVEQYLTQKDNNAAAYKLLGQALQRMGQKEKALEQYKASLDIDSLQTSTILDICELLADNEITIEPGRAKYWCEKAEATFPKHPVTFRLREKLIQISNPDPQALVNLLNSELAIRPKDALLHARLLKHYLSTNKIKEAFEHACNVEFGEKTFTNNDSWNDVLVQLLSHNSLNAKEWLYQLLLLTVHERICLLSITETPKGSSKSLVESNELLHAYDQALATVANAGAVSGFGEFHNGLLQHHRGQLAFHIATFLLKKAKKDQLSWRDATKLAGLFMLVAWQAVPLDSKVNWLRNAPEKQVVAVGRWYSDGTYRCSQAGHYLLANIQDKNEAFLDQVSQCYSVGHWRDKLYKKIFSSNGHLEKIKRSYLASNAFEPPILRLPRKMEVEAYDNDAQRVYGSSLHHFIWTLLNYKNYAHFKCTLFDMLTHSATSYGPETLNRCDIHAFLYCAALTAQQQLSSELNYINSDRPIILPVNITDLLCTLAQMKWWDCAYKFSQNELGSELTDIRATLSRGIETVRCVDNHGLDPELLCLLGRIFSEKANMSTNINDKSQFETRAGLYYSSAIPLLEKLKGKLMAKYLDKRMFEYTHKDLSTKELNGYIEESKLYVAKNHLNEGDYDKVIKVLTNLKSPQAFYYLSLTYKKTALEENNLSKDSDIKSKFVALLTKAKSYAYKALDILKAHESNKNQPLYSETQELLEEIETHMNEIDPDLSIGNNYGDRKYSSDENLSGRVEPVRINSHNFRNISSTPKASSNANVTNYRTAVDSHIFENTRTDQIYFERIENEIRGLQKRDTTISDFMEQTKAWFDENRKIGNQIISTINSNMQNTTDQFKLLKISIDNVKDQIDECRNECKDVGELKRQVAELKREVDKFKKVSEQTIDSNSLYNLDDDYRTNDSTSTFSAQLPFTPSQMVPPFNQRIVPPFPVPQNPYHLYNQSLYNLYNQYSQFAQPSTIPGPQPIFDPTRGQVNYPGVYPTPDQMYMDVAHLAPPSGGAIPAVPSVPIMTSLATVPIIPTGPLPPPATTAAPSKPPVEKDTSRSLPVNVVITSSDPLPTCTTTPAPILSVTIPPKHIKGTPHNYQIAMPSSNDTNVMSPPVFVFPAQNNKATTATSFLSDWSQSSIFKTSSLSAPAVSSVSTLSSSPLNISKLNDTSDTSKSVVDGSGLFVSASPNTSLNKSRTLSERSNTSVENYDPCPDFKPIVPLPAEIKVTTGEEDELVIFSSRAKLFRFVDKQWKERGLGEMKLLKHKTTGKVRVLMRREQVHKICANHVITGDMEIKPMKNETKAYFWVANDFADQTVVLEKFCIRFKTADIALDFYNAFEKARQESSSAKTTTPTVSTAVSLNLQTGGQAVTENNSKPNASQPGKAIVGGFTFSGTPTFKPVAEELKLGTKSAEKPTNKTNVFSGILFKSNTSSPFTNLFNTTSSSISSPTQSLQTAQVSDTSNKLNTPDTVEEFEPTVDFKPVVPLPALIEQKTGEEDEVILFEHRAKLLRFDSEAKEWKERGLGNIKLLMHIDNTQKVRLLMRREQIMKVCCNHALTKDMVFEKMPNLDKAVTWCAKDFSDGELVAETFCLRFKTVQLCDDFIKAIKDAQVKIKDETKTAKEEQNASAKSNAQIGFGDEFKPKAGSWHCDTCYTNNLETFSKCACCEQPRPKTSGSNSNDAAEPAKPATMIQQPVGLSWGDKFKPKPGSWECKDCLVRNESSIENCSACNSPKDPTTAKPTSNSLHSNVNLFTSGGTTQFRFGIPPAANNQKTDSVTTSIFDGTGAHKFSFGIPQDKPASGSITEQKPQTNLFGISKSGSEEQSVDFTLKNRDEKSIAIKPALLPTPTLEPTKDTTSSTPFAIKENNSFGFVFKPPTKGKSPIKSPQNQDGDDSDGNEFAAEDECPHSFTPVIPLPDKVEVVTGEENETELYSHAAKLYKFTLSEWKERGRGVVKILKHKDTGKLRVVMRRDQVLKICLNHALTPEIIYSQKDEKTWLFVANDFSEGELSLQNFCLRFKNKEVAVEFKAVIDKALEGLSGNSVKEDKEKCETDDVVFVSETLATSEEKEKAKELMLPENFFTYKNKEPCQGCRGCDDDVKKSASEVTLAKSTEMDTPTSSNAGKPSVATALSKAVFVTGSASTPIKNTTPLLQSPTNSVYGTPNNLEKTFDTSVFRTPLGSLGSNKSTTPLVTPGIFGNNITNKENALSLKPNLFSGHGEQQNLFGTPQNYSSPIFGGGNTLTPVIKSSLLAPPKLSSLNTSNESQNENTLSFGADQEQAKAVFSQAKTIFSNTTLGTSSNQSIFSFSNDKTDKQPIKSIFGDSQKSENLFTSVNQGSVFGLSALSNQSATDIFETTGAPVFSSATSQNKPSVFGGTESFNWKEGVKNTFNQSPFGALTNPEQKKVDTPSVTNNKEVEASKEVCKPEKKETLFSVDNSLSFAALSSNSGDVFSKQKKPDFQWEGAGQQLFKTAQKTGNENNEKSKNDSGAGDDVGPGGDEDYDPHYEPIVPLPDKIVVTTGEEDEEKMFGERCKLFRYDERTREWKERGVGELKILYHPERKTYRLLMRREQVHKAVLNMLLYTDLELLPMKNSDRAYTWAGRNFAENAAGEQETLAVRYKTVSLAMAFKDKIIECVRKMQAMAAQAVREEKEAVETINVPLRLPKHLQESARADNAISAVVTQHASTAQMSDTSVRPEARGDDTESVSEVFKQVHFQEEAENNDYDDEDYDPDYEAYYNEEEEESAAYYTCDGEAIISQGSSKTDCANAHIQVLYDQEIYSPKILVTDSMTGEILADMLIYTETEFKMDGDSCTWSGTDYTSNDPVDKTVTINFYDSETAMQFYDSCETSKAATYSSTDPES